MVTSDIKYKKKKVKKKKNREVKKIILYIMFQKASRADSYNSIKGHIL